ncbi:MAG: hypothetical protein V4487_00215, partial [Chlamydiota bacterium]
MLNIAIICGGPSRERGISLNSARSFLDHTSSLDLCLTVFYVNPKGAYYQLTPGQLYSNTPSDFDFKLAQNATPLNETSLIARLLGVDLVFPLIHGTYGEDGALQQFLETHRIPFVGASSRVCRTIFNKYLARKMLMENGFQTLPSMAVISKEASIASFWKQHGLKQAIVKPTESGSSIGVTSVKSIEAAQSAIALLWEQGFREILIEPYCEDAEFTICVLESHEGFPQALIPLEIDIG